MSAARKLEPATALASAASELASRGLAVFPLLPGKKVPATKHGFKDASTDAGVVRGWWEGWPEQNIGVATGEVSGVFVLDIDDEKGGEASVAALGAKHGPLPPTVESITGKGRHLWFRYPAGIDLGCTEGTLGAGIDTRANGGYAVAPPSVHPNGKRYAWSVDSADSFADLPEWLIALTQQPRAKASAGGDPQGAAEDRAALVRKILTGESYHGPLRDLAFRSIGAGVSPGQVVADLQGIMLAVTAPHDDRWSERFSDIPRLVDTAQAKRGDPEPPQGEQPAPPAVPLVRRDVWEMLKSEPPARLWQIPDWMPGDDVTGLFADGGEGKTQAGLQLCYCTAANMPWLGMEVRRGAAGYLSAEEPWGELHYRLAQIARGIIVPAEASRHALEVVSRASEDALLATFTKAGAIQPTPLWNEAQQMIGDLKLSLLVLDASADIYGGAENERAQVRAFIAMLRRPAIAHRCAILLMGHPSRDGMKTGLGYSGSTAWHNSLRARWYLTTPKAGDGEEPDQGVRELSLEKSNRGRRGQKLTLRWRDGWFGVEQGAGGDFLRLAEAKTRFLELLAAYTGQDRTVSPKPTARNYAPTVFAGDKSGKHFSRDTYKAAMDALFADGRLGVEPWPPNARPSRQSERLAIR